MNKTRIKKLLSILAVSLLFSIKSLGQTDSLPKIKVMARALPDKIILRWAPTTPLAWQIINKYGYTIEKVIMTKKNKLVKNRELQKLTETPIQPYTEDQWEKVVQDEEGVIDNNAAIAVQAIYGGSFVLTEDYTNDITKVIEKAQENEKRFTFALFAADQSVKVAEAMGLLYVDNEVIEDEKYLYRIYANVPVEKMAIDTGYIYIGPVDYAELPRPLDLYADFGEHDVTLSWNRELFEQIFSNYQVERSDNAKDFYPLDDLPFINTAPDNNKNPRLMYRMDSISDKNKTYYYRIRGRTIFQEWGPWSDTVSGQAVSVLKYKPAIHRPEIIDNNKVKLNWDFPAEYQNSIEYFSVYRANKSNGDYQPIVENLNPDKRTYTDKQPMMTNYYIIRAFDKNEQSGGSFPALAQLVDSFPPAQPLMPKAIIDTLGNVTLSWIKSPEEDILGYRVFRSNFKTEEFGQITNATVQDTLYYDQILLNNLSKKIYYKIAAIDRNFNQSELSEAVLLLKPDIIPPSPPLFKAPKSKSEGVLLEWINSFSKDVAKHILYRREAGKESWTTVAVFPLLDSINSFIDKQIQPKLLFEYILLAVDSANNESIPCKSVFARKIDNGIRPAPEDIRASVDKTQKQVELKWDYPYLDIKNFLIYRGENEKAIAYYKMIEGDKTTFIDKNIILNTKYKYRLKARFSDGSESAFSREIFVEF